MEELSISFGKNRMDKSWKVDYLTWPEFVARLRKVRKTKETAAQYRGMSPNQQARIKDGPCFVGGVVEGGRRIKGNVRERSLITIDYDDVTTDFINDAWLSDVGGNAAFIYSTHSHNPKGKHKYRVIMPTDRPMVGDEYLAVIRKVAEIIGMDGVDRTSFQIERLMYMPSCSADVEPDTREFDGEPLSVDEILGMYEDWTDRSSWPLAPGEREALSSVVKKLGDPREVQHNVIAAFNRVYDIRTAIDTFLADVYEPCGERYTFIEGTSSGGLRVYADHSDLTYDAWAYSEHATDPANTGHCQHAFDLVRIHKFGDLDTDVNDKTPKGKYPSVTAMLQLATKDQEVKRLLVVDDFGDDDFLASCQDDSVTDGEQPEEEQDPDEWRVQLEINEKTGKVLPTAGNAQLVLENAFNGVLAYDEFQNSEVIRGPLPWRERRRPNAPYEHWTGDDDRRMLHYFDKVQKISGKDKIMNAFTEVTRSNSFHPIKEYMESLPQWDELPRVETLFIEYLGAEDTPYVRAVTRKMLLAAVKRLYEPGCKFDEMLVLVGPQGVGKSSLLAKLGRQWFSDSLKSFDDEKKAGEHLQSGWIFELGELAGMKKAEVEDVKQFLSKTEDKYRVAYDRQVSTFPRKCVFFGTTNNTEFLVDDTGNRRFWPVEVGCCPPVYDHFEVLDDDEVGQIWAEVLTMYRSGESLQLPDEIKKGMDVIHAKHTPEDPRMGLIQEWLDQEVATDEFELEPMRKRDTVCAMQIAVECLGMRRDDGNIRWKNREICSMLDKMPGWKRGGRKYVPGYGKQTAYVRED